MQSGYLNRARAIEHAWRKRFGDETMNAVHRVLETLVRPDAERSPLFVGLSPLSGGWRAQVPVPLVLSHFPMVLHKGGYPDGS